jgi:hypothetical protein
MKALTLTQPWATLVAIGAKRIETRSWSTQYRGPLAIHAAKGIKEEHFVLARFGEFQKALSPFYPEVLHQHSYPTWPLGAIIAVCELTDCLEIQPLSFIIPDKPERSFGDYTPGRFAWILGNVHQLKEPIPAHGALGLWTFAGEIPEKETYEH